MTAISTIAHLTIFCAPPCGKGYRLDKWPPLDLVCEFGCKRKIHVEMGDVSTTDGPTVVLTFEEAEPDPRDVETLRRIAEVLKS